MAVKKHCIVCGTLVFTGFTCPDCQYQIFRSRTADDESLEDWLGTMKGSSRGIRTERIRVLDSFWEDQHFPVRSEVK